MNSESLVVIRTYGGVLDADEAQLQLLNAGIYSLILADENASLGPNLLPGQGVALAVHRRDVQLAEAALTPDPESHPPA